MRATFDAKVVTATRAGALLILAAAGAVAAPVPKLGALHLKVARVQIGVHDDVAGVHQLRCSPDGVGDDQLLVVRRHQNGNVRRSQASYPGRGPGSLGRGRVRSGPGTPNQPMAANWSSADSTRA